MDAPVSENPAWVSFSADYHRLTNSLSKAISEVPGLVGEDRKRLIIDGDDNLREANIMLRQFSNDVKIWPISERMEVQGQLEIFRAALAEQEKDFNRAKRTSTNPNRRRGAGGRLNEHDQLGGQWGQ